jgi:hypothetical protein
MSSLRFKSGKRYHKLLISEWPQLYESNVDRRSLFSMFKFQPNTLTRSKLTLVILPASFHLREELDKRRVLANPI